MEVKVKGLSIGGGRPKICVPITGRTIEEIKEQSAAAKESAADLIELRIDYFANANGMKDVTKVIDEVRKVIEDVPVIFTFRTKQEGGECEISIEDYKKIILNATENNRVDFVDVEYNSGRDIVSELCKKLELKGVFSIVSNHDFNKTLSENEMIERMEDMQSLGADIVKMAMMPQNKYDVLNIMKATVIMKEKLNVPVITMSMGEMGAVSRICGEFTGSAVTFATVSEASAPGQMEADKVRQCLELIHEQFI